MEVFGGDWIAKRVELIERNVLPGALNDQSDCFVGEKKISWYTFQHLIIGA